MSSHTKTHHRSTSGYRPKSKSHRSESTKRSQSRRDEPLPKKRKTDGVNPDHPRMDVPPEFQMEWHFIPEWKAHVYEKKDILNRPHSFRNIHKMKAYIKENKFRKNVAHLCNSIVELCERTYIHLNKKNKADQALLSYAYKTHIEHLEEWLVTTYPTSSRILVSSQDHEKDYIDKATEMKQSLSAICFIAINGLNFMDAIRSTHGQAISSNRQWIEITRELAGVNKRCTAWFRSAYNCKFERSSPTDWDKWKTEMDILSRCAVDIIFHRIDIEPDKPSESNLLMVGGMDPREMVLLMEHITRTWSFIYFQHRLVTARFVSAHTYVAQPSSKEKLNMFIDVYSKTIDETTKRAFGTLALKHLMTDGTHEFFFQKKAPITNFSSIQQLNKSENYMANEASEIKMYGSVRTMAGPSFSEEEMTTFLDETFNCKPTEIYENKDNQWQVLLKMQILTEIIKNHFSSSIEFTQTYYITPFSLWTRLQRLVRIPECLLPPCSEDRYPVIVPLLGSIFVQCHGTGGPLVMTDGIESAIVFLFASISILHRNKAHNGADLTTLIEECIDHAAEKDTVDALLQSTKCG